LKDVVFQAQLFDFEIFQFPFRCRETIKKLAVLRINKDKKINLSSANFCLCSLNNCNFANAKPTKSLLFSELVRIKR